MTNDEILKFWLKHEGQGADALLRFSRLLIQAERAACVEACKKITCWGISGATDDYMEGKEMAAQQCGWTISARNDLPTGE